MRARLGLMLLSIVLAVAGATAVLRWSFFSQSEHPDLRLSEQRLPALTKRLVIILVDSVPFEMAFTQRKLPFISSQAPLGTHGIVFTEEPTMTGQMVYTIASGMRPFLYGVVRNWRQNRFGHETFMDSLASAGRRIELYGDAPWTEMFPDRFHHKVTFAEEGRTPDGRPFKWMNALNDIDLKILPHLDHALSKAEFDVLIWHIHGTDLVMHKYLRDSTLTAVKLAYADLLTEGIVRQLQDGKTTFLVFSDHGCAKNGRHGYEDPEARNAFFLLFGSGITRGVRRDIRQIDLASTITALFGRSPPAASAGRPAVEALDVSPGRRARILLDAAQNRSEYLAARERWQPTGLGSGRGLVVKAEAALAAGDPGLASEMASLFLRQAYREDLGARRERRWGPPLLLAFGLAVLLAGIFFVGLGGSGTFSSPGSFRAACLAALSVALLWSAGLAGAKWMGRLFNDHVDLFSPLGKAAFWSAVVAALGLLALLLLRPMRRAFAAHGAIWTLAACFALALLPGYFQGIYSLIIALGLLGLFFLLRADPAPRAWIGYFFSAAVLVVFLLWEWDWEANCFGIREHFRGSPGALGACASFLLAALALRRPWSGHRDIPRRWLAGPLALAALLLIRHLGFPLEPRDLFPTVGDQLLSDAVTRGAFVALGSLAWWLLHRLGALGGAQGSVLGALAVLCLWGSSFEATAFSLLTVAFAPFACISWLERPGLAGAALAAALMATARVVFVQVHEFHVHFTALHDLFRFAPDTDALLPELALPIALRYSLPALVLVALLWGRLSPKTRTAALGILLVFAGARVIHLLLITRLTIDQLYPNWRGMGELVLTSLWAVSLALVALGWELASSKDSTLSPVSGITASMAPGATATNGE
ncbi:MAG: alkaline phosphatase family protein [Polyangia bacterium]|jgi:hypothetical protein|nr:alkaline phosphatase family protein [Polyangia bacterium]